MKKSEALEQRKKLLNLIEQWTRAEIMARLGRFDNLEFVDYAQVQVEKRDEIRRLVFGTDNLVELNKRWGLVKPKQRKRKGDRNNVAG